jgi:uncharacterized protein (DUF1501 family)
MTRPEDSVLSLNTDRIRDSAETGQGDDLADFVRRNTLEAYATSEHIAEVLRAEDRGASYPSTALAGRLRLVARLIKSGAGTRVYYTSQATYDTHYGQGQSHAILLSELAGALRAFLDDLAAAKLGERVVVLAFSEFGRRVQENGSQGTDHGTSGPVFLAGQSVLAGLSGERPQLMDLEDGDLKMTVDFRSVYATVLEDWLGLPSKTALAGTFKRLPLFRT